ncbi:MAG TPA: RNA polymerase sigma factor [Gaiellaceae bacterium]
MASPEDTARLYEAYGEQLFRFCQSRLGSAEEAEDAVQNTFMRVHRALQKGVEPEFEEAWLYRIAANVCASRSELTGRRAQWQSGEAVDDVQVAAPDRDPEAARELVAAVAKMPKNLRDAILLREWQGLSYAEIAESLDTTVPAVETLLWRARKHLARTLRPFRRVGLLDVAALAAKLRGLVAVSAPAQMAVGAAALAVGGVVAADTIAADTHRSATAVADRTTIAYPHARAPEPRLAAAHTAVAAVPAAHRVARRAAPTHVAPMLVVLPGPHVRAVPAVEPAAPAPAPAAPPPQEAALTLTSPSPQPAQTAVSTPRVKLALPAPVAAALPPVEAPAVTVTAPALSVPAVTVPVVTTPSVTVPVPTVTLP